jgi:transposase
LRSISHRSRRSRRSAGDKAFDADPFIAALDARAITPVIPSKSIRKTPRPCDFALYCERNLIERFFNELKNFRAIATRYDKLAKTFLAGISATGSTIPATLRPAASTTPSQRRSTASFLVFNRSYTKDHSG